MKKRKKKKKKTKKTFPHILVATHSREMAARPETILPQTMSRPFKNNCSAVAAADDRLWTETRERRGGWVAGGG